MLCEFHTCTFACRFEGCNMQDHDAQLERLKRALSVESDTAFSQILDISQGSVSGAKKRKQIPYAWFVQVAEKSNVSLDWLFFGTGAMRQGEAESHVNEALVAAQPIRLETCSRCQKLENELAIERESSRKKDELLVEWLKKVEEKIEESGQLRLENLKLQMRLDTAATLLDESAHLKAENTELKARLSLFTDAAGESA